MKVYLVQGEHFNVPGIPTSIFQHEISANMEAADLVNIMLKDTGSHAPAPNVGANTWQPAMNWLQDCHGAAHCWVEVTEHEVEGYEAKFR